MFFKNLSNILNGVITVHKLVMGIAVIAVAVIYIITSAVIFGKLISSRNWPQKVNCLTLPVADPDVW